MKKFNLTFGADHPLVDNFIEIEAEDMEKARKLAFEKFGKHWSFVYEEDDWEESYFPGGKVGKTLK